MGLFMLVVQTLPFFGGIIVVGALVEQVQKR